MATARVRLTVDFDMEVEAGATAQFIEFRHNDSSTCANETLGALVAYFDASEGSEEGECMCLASTLQVLDGPS